MKNGLMVLVALALGACGNDFGPQGDGGTTTDGGAICTLNGITCAANSHCEGNTCVCNAGFALDGGVCAAVPDAGSSTCGLVAQCAANSHCENNACVCDQGFTLINNVCVAGACGQAASCAANSHCENNACVCNAGFAMVNGACAAIACGLVTQCAANSHCENNACVCDQGFTLINNVCVAGACGQVASCAANSHCENNACVCNAGYTNTNGTCVPVACGLVTQCAANSHCENNACVCNTGFGLVNGVCTANSQTDGGAISGTSAMRVEVTRASNNQGFSMATNWWLTMWGPNGERVSGFTQTDGGVNGDMVAIDVTARGGYYWFTDQRNRSNNDERAPPACQSAADAGYVVTLVYSGGMRVNVSANVKAKLDTDANNGRRKWQVWFKPTEQPSSCS